MNCPRCDTAILVEGAHDGILIFMCPNCRGLWLDRGVIDKLIIRVEPEWEKRKD